MRKKTQEKTEKTTTEETPAREESPEPMTSPNRRTGQEEDGDK